MGRIQSNVGLISGVAITDTVDQLIALSAEPRDRLVARNEELTAQQIAISSLTAKVLGVQLAVGNLTDDANFVSRQVQSSNSSLLSVTASDDTPVGSYQFTPLRRAQAQQLLSSGVAADDQPLGAGTLSLRRGGFVGAAMPLELINGGVGFERGQIRITDRSGAAQTIDLTTARTIDDVLAAVNAADGIEIIASTDGDRIRLTDHTGQTGNLSVEQVGFGTTASDLGLAGIDAAVGEEAIGVDLVRLYDDLHIGALNDNNGVVIRGALPDLDVTLRDGSTLSIDFNRYETGDDGAVTVHREYTLGDLLTTINAADPSQLRAEIAADGKRLVLTDLTVDDGDPNTEFTVASHALGGAHVAEQLGLTGQSVDGVITGGRLIGGLNTSLLSSLDGGAGLGQLTTITLTDRSGASATVDLSAAETLQDVIDVVNQSGLDITASVNGARSGIALVDNSGETESNLIVGLTRAQGATTGAGDNAGLVFSAQHGGTELNGVTVLLVDDAAAQGSETVEFDESDPDNRRLIVHIAEGQTTANDVIAALERTPDVGDLFAAEQVDGGNGTGLVQTWHSTLLVGGSVSETAQRLGLTVDAAADQFNGASLGLQWINENTELDGLNGGGGVDRGTFLITDSLGAVATIVLTDESAETVGDVIDAINQSGIGVRARINNTGDGMLLEDTAGGARTLSVEEHGALGRTARDLNLLVESTTIDGAQVIDGSRNHTIQVEADDTLQTLVEKINELDVGLTAGVLNVGGGSKPYRLTLNSEQTGAAGQFVFDTSQTSLQLQTVTEAQDALVQFGSSVAGAGALLTSSTNTFDDVLAGMDLTVGGTSSDPVHVTVEVSEETLLTNVRLLVDQYNALRDELDTLAAFDEETLQTGLLFGSVEILRIDTDLGDLLTGRFFDVGDIQSLGELGLRIDQDGKMSLFPDKLTAKFAEAPDQVREFLTNEDAGVSVRLSTLVDQFAAADNSLLTNRYQALQSQIEANNDRIDTMNVKLDGQRLRLLKDFYNMELVIGRMQTNLTVIEALQPVQPLSFVSS